MSQSIFQAAGIGVPQQPQQSAAPMNPFQKAQMVMQAMTNPAAFMKRMYPDIPNEIMNDPNRVMQYMQQTRGITQNDIANVENDIRQGGVPWR